MSESISKRLRGRVRRMLGPLPAIAVWVIAFGRFKMELFRRLPTQLRWRKGDRLRIGVDVTPLYEKPTGVGWYLYEILVELALRDDVEIFAYGEPWFSDAGPLPVVELPDGIELRSFDLSGVEIPRFGHHLINLMWLVNGWLDRLDLIWGANYFLPARMKYFCVPVVLTVHDLTWKRYPELLQQETLSALNEKMTGALLEASRVVTVSESTRRDLIEFFEVSPVKVETVLSGIRIDERETSETVAHPRPYILFVSTIEPRKDLDTLLSAFELLADRNEFDGDLVVAGRVGWSSGETVERMDSSRYADRIVHLDYVDRDRLFELYGGAEVFVMPSLYEGFGLPILEAMSMGTPVVCTNVSSLPEVAADAAMIFEPRDSEGLADRLRRVLSEDRLRKEMIERGKRRASELDWGTTAQRTLEVFRKAGAR